VYDAARAYAPNQVFLGNLTVDQLAKWPTPWWKHPVDDAPRFGPDGEIMPEDEFLGLLASGDGVELLTLERDVAERAQAALDSHPIVGKDSGRPPIRPGMTSDALEERIARHAALPLVSSDGQLLGAMLAGHEEDDTLTAQVLLENLAVKATAGLALSHL